MSAEDIKNKQEKSKSKANVYLYLAIFFFFVGTANLGWGVYQSQQNQERLTKAGTIRVLSQQVAKNAAEASQGNVEAFALLDNSIKEFDALFGHLERGDESKGLEASPLLILDNEVKRVGNLWIDMNKNAAEIAAGRETIVKLYQIQEELSSSIPQMEFLYTNVQDTLLDNRAPAEQVMYATRQSTYLERIIRSFQKVLIGGGDAELASENFGQDVDIFGEILTGMLEGDEMLGVSRIANADARASLDEVSSLYVVS